jgi:hypothetical protein
MYEIQFIFPDKTVSILDLTHIPRIGDDVSFDDVRYTVENVEHCFYDKQTELRHDCIKLHLKEPYFVN